MNKQGHDCVGHDCIGHNYPGRCDGREADDRAGKVRLQRRGLTMLVAVHIIVG